MTPGFRSQPVFPHAWDKADGDDVAGNNACHLYPDRGLQTSESYTRTPGDVEYPFML